MALVAKPVPWGKRAGLGCVSSGLVLLPPFSKKAVFAIVLLVNGIYIHYIQCTHTKKAKR